MREKLAIKRDGVLTEMNIAIVSGIWIKTLNVTVVLVATFVVSRQLLHHIVVHVPLDICVHGG